MSSSDPEAGSKPTPLYIARISLPPRRAPKNALAAVVGGVRGAIYAIADVFENGNHVKAASEA